MRNGFLSYMRRMMINCEEASLLSTHEMLGTIPMKEKVDLHMHLMGCKHCRRYYRQGIIINNTIRQIKNTEHIGQAAHRLSTTEKSSLQRMINNNIKSQ